ncbi:MAG: hypothetical protein IPH66_02900 [Crocinitomicaceae bacterium]|nr:hypothetical protein [Crocinitomicaceae bacterium]
MSAGHLRYHIANDNGYNDMDELKEQYLYYQKLNQAILVFCNHFLLEKNDAIADFCKSENFSYETINQ